MPKILVADDNSNVLKTAQLALADLGAEISSVNNGEAAVRNMASFEPDLVLADIFMPVRNGYEVCEYIKKTPRFSHVPVVLLVGAFDPLDEREAQRVGADGILKKPFVPTNPLITMVKMLLERAASQREVPAPVPAPVSASTVPANVAATRVQSAVQSVASDHAAVAEMPEEVSPEEFPALAEPVAFAEHERPLAFSQLIEGAAAPTTSPGPTDTASLAEEQMVRQRDPTLGQPIFWHNEASKTEPAIEISADDADREPETSVHQHIHEQRVESSAGESPLPLLPIEPFELVLEEPDPNQASVVVPEKLVVDPAATADLSVDAAKASDLTANHLEWFDAAPESDPAAKLEPKTETEESKGAGAAMDTVEPTKDVPLAADVPLEAPDGPASTNLASPITRVPVQTPEDTVKSVPQLDWAALTAVVEDRTVPAETLETGIFPLDMAKRAVASTESAIPSSPSDSAFVEAVAQRVLDRMRPQVVELVTTELLKPIVLAMIQREIEIINQSPSKTLNTSNTPNT